MQTIAAICHGPGSDFKLEQVELGSPRPTEVVVRLTASGMCHTDLSVRSGLIPFPLPGILGHEGAGVVEETGLEVSTVEPGDQVALVSPSCGHCGSCQAGHPATCARGRALRWSGKRSDGSPVAVQGGAGIAARFLGQSAFAEYTLVEERTVVKISDPVAATTLAPFGCGVITGAGAILNVLRPRPGASVVVLGAGAVGLSAVMAAALAPVSRIIAADIVGQRLAMARELGASDVIDSAGQTDLADALRELTGGAGADIVVDTTGNTAVLEQGLAALAQSGTLGLIGAGRADAAVRLRVMPFLSAAQTLRGIIMGDGTPTFLRTLIGYHRQGRFPVEKLVHTYPFRDIEAAASDSRSAQTIKPVLTFS